MRKAIAYLRVSTMEQVTGGFSLESQKSIITNYCTFSELELVHVITEEGISGSKALSKRPGGQELIKILNQKKVAHVVAWKLDRLFRDAADALQQTKDWDKAKIILHLVDMGGQTMNTSSALGRFFLSMLAGFAEFERNQVSERTKAVMQLKKRKLEVYSPTPYGYSKVQNILVADTKEQEIIKNITRLRKKGKSYKYIAEQLAKHGAPTKQGGKWHAGTVRYLIKNNLYKTVHI